MTIRDYITSKLQAFSLTDAQFLDVTLDGIDLDADVTSDNQVDAGKAMITIIEDFIFAPRQTNISEGGFSESWDYEELGKWWLMLCKKYGVTPKEDILEFVNLSVIIDRTDEW